MKGYEAEEEKLIEASSGVCLRPFALQGPGKRWTVCNALHVHGRATQISRSPLSGRYDEEIDRASAYELLKTRTQTERTACWAPCSADGRCPGGFRDATHHHDSPSPADYTIPSSSPSPGGRRDY